MVTCISCGKEQNGNSPPIMEVLWQHDFVCTLIKCSYCDLIYLKNLPSKEFVSKMYNEGEVYFTDKTDEEEIRNRIGILDYAETLAVRSTGNFLEIGCARGYLLAAAKKRSWNTTGIEFSPDYCKYGNNVLQVNILEGDIMDNLPKLKEKFDVIVLWHVLEHLVNPSQVLLRLKSMLTSKGIIAIQVPDYEEHKEKIVGAFHVSYFTRKSLTNMMNLLNLKILSLDYDNTNKFISIRVQPLIT